MKPAPPKTLLIGPSETHSPNTISTLKGYVKPCTLDNNILAVKNVDGIGFDPSTREDKPRSRQECNLGIAGQRFFAETIDTHNQGYQALLPQRLESTFTPNPLSHCTNMCPPTELHQGTQHPHHHTGHSSPGQSLDGPDT